MAGHNLNTVSLTIGKQNSGRKALLRWAAVALHVTKENLISSVSMHPLLASLTKQDTSFLHLLLNPRSTAHPGKQVPGTTDGPMGMDVHWLPLIENKKDPRPNPLLRESVRSLCLERDIQNHALSIAGRFAPRTIGVMGILTETP